MKRRDFFKMGGMVGAIAAGGVIGGVVGTKVLSAKDNTHIDKIKEQALRNGILTIHTKYGILDDSSHPSRGIYISSGPTYRPGTVKEYQVGMVPGPDGELYLRINNEWRKVVTE
jgi:hypothetical protein